MDMLGKLESLVEVAKDRIGKDILYEGSYIALVNILEKIVKEEKEKELKMCETLYKEKGDRV